MEPVAVRRGSIPFTIPETDAWIGDETNPAASAIFCPAST